MPEWRRFASRIGELEDDIIESWECANAQQIIYEGYVRHFWCELGWMKQLAIMKKYEKCEHPHDKEPTMHEKLRIMRALRTIDFEEEVALEVFPKKEKIVDNLDLYHVWILERKNCRFHATLRKPKFAFAWKSIILGSKRIFYKKRKIFKKGIMITVYFLKTKNNTEFAWYEKQKFKDSIIGKDVAAVEFIEESRVNVATLVCIPEKVGNLPFGLRN